MESLIENLYPIVLAGGATACLLWLGLSNTPKFSIQPNHRLDAGLAALALGIVGARLAFVLTHLAYYTKRPVESLWFWQGGLSWVGAAIGSLVGIGIYAFFAKLRFLELVDTMAIPAAILSISGWFGCLLDGCAYGMKADSFPLAPDLLGNLAARWPTQAIGTILSLLILLVIWLQLERNAPPGRLGMLAMVLISGVNFILSFVRADPIAFVWGIRLDILASGAVFVLSTLGLLGQQFSRTGST
jgi:phosphatidylglycerol:prolipoprotein diacylglycerol transferase